MAGEVTRTGNEGFRAYATQATTAAAPEQSRLEAALAAGVNAKLREVTPHLYSEPRLAPIVRVSRDDEGRLRADVALRHPPGTPFHSVQRDIDNAFRALADSGFGSLAIVKVTRE